MNKFLNFIERVVKIFMLSSFFTILFLLIIFSLFYLFGVVLSDDAIYYFSSVVFLCMAIISYEFLKEIEFDK